MELLAPATVTIIDGEPYPGRVTIAYCPAGGLTAKKIAMPKHAFLEACAKYANELDAKSKEPQP
jgi:hypothetical protein